MTAALVLPKAIHPRHHGHENHHRPAHDHQIGSDSLRSSHATRATAVREVQTGCGSGGVRRGPSRT